MYDREYPDSTLSVPEITNLRNPGGPLTGYLKRDHTPGTTNYTRSARTAENGFVRALGPAGAADNDRDTAEANALAAYTPPDG